MSDQWGGPGWWIGGDGMWHPPREPATAREKPHMDRPVVGDLTTESDAQVVRNPIEPRERPSAEVPPQDHSAEFPLANGFEPTTAEAPLLVEIIEIDQAAGSDSQATNGVGVPASVEASNLFPAPDVVEPAPPLPSSDIPVDPGLVFDPEPGEVVSGDPGLVFDPEPDAQAEIDTSILWPDIDLRNEIASNRETILGTAESGVTVPSTLPPIAADTIMAASGSPSSPVSPVSNVSSVSDRDGFSTLFGDREGGSDGTNPASNGTTHLHASHVEPAVVQDVNEGFAPTQAESSRSVDSSSASPPRQTPTVDDGWPLPSPSTSKSPDPEPQLKIISPEVGQPATVSLPPAQGTAELVYSGPPREPIKGRRFRKAGPILLAFATALALLSGLLGALWLRERNAAEELREELAASQVVAVDDAEVAAILDQVGQLRSDNAELQQQLDDALVGELPRGRVSDFEVDFTPLFADETNGRVIAIDASGEYRIWDDGSDDTLSGSVGAIPTGMFVARNRAFISTETQITVLRLNDDSDSVTFEYGPSRFLLEDGRGFWTFNETVRGVELISKNSGEVESSVPIPARVVDLAVGAGSVWALGDDGLVYRVNTADLTVQPLEVGEDVISITASPDALWALSARDGALRRVDPVSGDVLVTVPVGSDPIDASFGGNSVWVNLRSGESLIEVDTRTSAVASRTTLPGEPTGLHQGDSGVFVTLESDDVRLVLVSSLISPVADADASQVADADANQVADADTAGG